LNPFLIPNTKVNSEWIIHLNSVITIKLLENKREENLNDLGNANDFLDTTPKA